VNQYYVYLLANFTNSVIYTGVTNDLVRRVYEHREKAGPGFTNRYQAWKLVYFEVTEDIESAISREKQIKGGSRAKKVALIAGGNPTWRDLYPEIV
jgi:putative endonuclease